MVQFKRDANAMSQIETEMGRQKANVISYDIVDAYLHEYKTKLAPV